jgi:hypothetical protein
MVFVDTGGWIAVTVVSDSFHKVATTYYVDLLSPAFGFSHPTTSWTRHHPATTLAMPKHAGFLISSSRRKSVSW